MKILDEIPERAGKLIADTALGDPDALRYLIKEALRYIGAHSGFPGFFIPYDSMQPRPGASAITYAFDKDGIVVMLMEGATKDEIRQKMQNAAPNAEVRIIDQDAPKQ